MTIATTTSIPGLGAGVETPTLAAPGPGRVRQACYHALYRALTAGHNGLMRLGKALGSPPRQHPPPEGWDILLTGRFESANWLRAHLAPLARSSMCRRLRVVSSYPIPKIDKVEAITPPNWLSRLIGSTPARLAIFIWVALTSRPDFIGGFHLLINSLVATAVAPWVGARSMYFCVGGALEFAGGGVWHADGNPFTKMVTPDAHVERRLLTAISGCDVVVTMGVRARAAMRQAGITSRIEVVCGGLDDSVFLPQHTSLSAKHDVIVVGRLVPIKRMDILLEALALASEEVDGLSAVIVGDGPLRQALEEQAGRLGLTERVLFLGHREDVHAWIQRSRLFVLTSDSEGLALSLMEAMMSGLPAVVSDVGELGTLVTDGADGFLVPRRHARGFADRIVELLTNEPRRQLFARRAAQTAGQLTINATARQWDGILAAPCLTARAHSNG